MCGRYEEPIHLFQNTIIDRMIGIDRVPDGDNQPMSPIFAADSTASH